MGYEDVSLAICLNTPFNSSNVGLNIACAIHLVVSAFVTIWILYTIFCGDNVMFKSIKVKIEILIKYIINMFLSIYVYIFMSLMFVLISIISKLSFNSFFKKVNITKKDVERKIKEEGVLRSIRYIFMPTRMGAAIIKNKNSIYFSQYIKDITKFNLYLVSATVFVLFIGDIFTFMLAKECVNMFNFFLTQNNFFLDILTYSTLFLILIGGVSRIIEIFYAFYNDAGTHLEKKTLVSLHYSERVQLAMKSYLELLLWFGILYYSFSILCPIFQGGNMAFKDGKLLSIIDAVYFSGVTITTLGYGDISPDNFITKFLVIFEVLSGFTLIVVSFTIYVSRAIGDMNSLNRHKSKQLMKMYTAWKKNNNELQ